MDTRTLLKIINFYARFTPNYTKIGYWARRLTWPKTPPLDFAGQRWLVTGASSGLGKAMMHAAASANATVVGVSSN
jgi:NADPH:quinone reductase-like Zn-dependent oxidoreductase